MYFYLYIDELLINEYDMNKNKLIPNWFTEK